MATPVDQGQNTERVCQVKESDEEQPEPNSPTPAVEKRQIGFDCEFVECPPKVLQADCPVCLLVLREPHQVTCCGYGFCRVCIRHIEADKKPCPMCNRKAFSVFPDVRLQHSLYGFRVWCSHKTDGCEWRGELGQLEKHLNESPKLHEQLIGCEFVKVACHHCYELFQRRYITAHQIDECIRRPFSCAYCDNYGADFEDVTLKHWPVCAFYPVPCPSKCGECPERQNLEHHVSEDCPLTVVNCDFYYAGCEVQLPHKDLPAHLAENLVAHTSLMATYNRSKVQEKDQQIAQLTDDLRENKQLIIRLEKENEVLKQAVLEKTNKIAQLQKSQDDIEAGLNKELTQLKANTATKQELTQLKANTATKQELTQLKANTATKQELAQLKANTATKRELALLKANTATKRELALLKVNTATKQEPATKEELKGKAAVSKEDYETTKRELVQLKARIVLKEEYETTKQELAQLKTKQEDDRLSLRTLQSYTGPPVEFIMTEFEKHKQAGDHWYSEPFYTHPYGYKLCLAVEANGWGDCEGTHVSVWTHLMRGEFDGQLRWPFQGDITVQMINQLQDKEHRTEIMDFSQADEASDSIYISRVTTGEKAEGGWGEPKFLPHSELGHNRAKNCQFLKNDCLHFRVTQITKCRYSSES